MANRANIGEFLINKILNIIAEITISWQLSRIAEQLLFYFH